MSSVVTISVQNGPSITLPWASGLTAHQVLEQAYVQIGNAATFSFGIEYYGAYGYLVFMINQTCDTWSTTAVPYLYWEFWVNGVISDTGIDSTTLQPGDAISFAFTPYQAAKKDHPQVMAKRRNRA